MAAYPNDVPSGVEAPQKGWFTRIANAGSRFAGSPASFMLALAVVLGWAVSGPLFKFSDTWQLVINTGTTIVTFLMVFLIQSSQNRDSRALQIKLDELIRATNGARNDLLDLEDMEDTELDQVRHPYVALAREARTCAAGDVPERGTPELPPVPDAPDAPTPGEAQPPG